MATKPRVPVKYNEVVAHDGKTRSLAIGPKTGLVLATGGDDFAANVWKLGRPTSVLVSRSCSSESRLPELCLAVSNRFILQDFSENKRPITAVAFSASESYLALGSEGGAVKVVSLGSKKSESASGLNVLNSTISRVRRPHQHWAI